MVTQTGVFSQVYFSFNLMLTICLLFMSMIAACGSELALSSYMLVYSVYLHMSEKIETASFLHTFVSIYCCNKPNARCEVLKVTVPCKPCNHGNQQCLHLRVGRGDWLLWVRDL